MARSSSDCAFFCLCLRAGIAVQLIGHQHLAIGAAHLGDMPFLDRQNLGKLHVQLPFLAADPGLPQDVRPDGLLLRAGIAAALGHLRIELPKRAAQAIFLCHQPCKALLLLAILHLHQLSAGWPDHLSCSCPPFRAAAHVLGKADRGGDGRVVLLADLRADLDGGVQGARGGRIGMDGNARF